LPVTNRLPREASNYRRACAKAKEKNVVVNTIYCGDFDSGVSELWKNGADMTGGSYMSIDQNKKKRLHRIALRRSDYKPEHQSEQYLYLLCNKGVRQKEKQMTQDLNSEKYGQTEYREPYDFQKFTRIQKLKLGSGGCQKRKCRCDQSGKTVPAKRIAGHDRPAVEGTY